MKTSVAELRKVKVLLDEHIDRLESIKYKMENEIVNKNHQAS